MNVVEQNITSITELCQLHKVDRLFVFGSVLTDEFHEESDIDFLVKFGSKISLYHHFDNYMEFKESLEKLLQRPIDLVEEQTVKNPILKRSIDKNKKLLYG
ncbi:nucleotidyltransferase domain-containing protein [Pontibacter sp. 172403-2]|uniref:nucleotidyltransferase family protein n=1 Tax=Pontibacter rufus TaxID=2791028 RepID=UPI0018B00746|nr:nucleotidyltransferase domain-containing protein [Pontibacter sp. 172403-2]MBF9253550.1 nucleotidyltransferase domain-containing protein [Pontibacter sp. 172403-2]